MSENLYQGLQVLERDEHPLDRIDRLKAMTGPLLAWYGEHARILPWREEPTPYRVWISEIMLQQTRVEAVKPYFARFMEELPDVAALAAVPEERLLKLWEGLGYYNRARNLKKTAGILMEQYHGRLPKSRSELIRLPGIGSYTAGAIASIAYGEAVPAVDGNVLRVLSRVLASTEDIASASVKRSFEQDLGSVMPAGQSSAYNQGLIEIGAIVCVPNGEPHCGECPLCSVCLAARRNLTDLIPVKRRPKPRRIEERTILLIASHGRMAIRKRPSEGLLASLYEFPSLDGKRTLREVCETDLLQDAGILCAQSAPHVVHIFSHVEWHMSAFLIETERIPAQYIAADSDELRNRYPMAGAFDQYIRFLRFLNGESSRRDRNGQTSSDRQSEGRKDQDPGSPSEYH